MTLTTNKALNRMFDKLADPETGSSVLPRRAATKPKKSSQPARILIQADHCSGCNVRIPSGQFQLALAGKTIQCDHCRRHLYLEASQT